MPPVLKTRDDDPNSYTLPGGVLGPNGTGGVPADVAAAAGVRELTKTDELGYSVLDDDGQVQPLTGKDLNAAAQALADARGWTVVNVKQADLDPQDAGNGRVTTYAQRELGLAADRRPAAEQAEIDQARMYPDVDPLNTDPEQLATGIRAEQGGPDAVGASAGLDAYPADPDDGSTPPAEGGSNQEGNS